MKKLLSVLGAMTFVASGVSGVVACGNTPPPTPPVDPTAAQLAKDFDTTVLEGDTLAIKNVIVVNKTDKTELGKITDKLVGIVKHEESLNGMTFKDGDNNKYELDRTKVAKDADSSTTLDLSFKLTDGTKTVSSKIDWNDAQTYQFSKKLVSLDSLANDQWTHFASFKNGQKVLSDSSYEYNLDNALNLDASTANDYSVMLDSTTDLSSNTTGMGEIQGTVRIDKTSGVMANPYSLLAASDSFTQTYKIKVYDQDKLEKAMTDNFYDWSLRYISTPVFDYSNSSYNFMPNSFYDALARHFGQKLTYDGSHDIKEYGASSTNATEKLMVANGYDQNISQYKDGEQYSGMFYYPALGSFTAKYGVGYTFADAMKNNVGDGDSYWYGRNMPVMHIISDYFNAYIQDNKAKDWRQAEDSKILEVHQKTVKIHVGDKDFSFYLNNVDPTISDGNPLAYSNTNQVRFLLQNRDTANTKIDNVSIIWNYDKFVAVNKAHANTPVQDLPSLK